jgi:alkanesulfonate monooxygenase SsuD/methylene tetrahydromethanopterin reductase-like flavin-dependent oxidoreductase (luciferase family)
VILGAQFLPERFPEYLESVRAAEAAGYARAWLVDGQMLWQDVYVYLAHGLAATERIVFGPAVTNPYTRHFTVTASAAATLADLYPGRYVLGIGRGDNAVRTLGRDPVAMRTLGDVVSRIRSLAAGETVDLDGTDVRIRWAAHQVPIMMCATGPKNLRLAGALADIVMIYVGVNPESVKWAIDHVRGGAEGAGRDPDLVEISLLTAMWASDDQDDAWSRCRWAPAACANHIADTMRRNSEHGMPDAMTRLVTARDEYDYYDGHLDSTAAHTDYLTGELVDDFALAGPAARVLARVRELSDLGVSEISCAYLNGQLEQMDLVGREVIPALPRLTKRR